MSDESEWKKLPTIEKIEHKQWKARVEGYEEAVKLFQVQTSEKSNVFGDYVGLLKKMVADNNVIAQEKALDAVIAFMENSALHTRVASDVCSSVVSKCLGATRPKTKEKGIEILLLYIEIEKQDVVLEELVKGLSQKQPKLVIGTLQALQGALSSFGNKVVSIKTILKDTLRLLEDRDANIRNEGKELVVEMYRWAGAPIKTQLSGLKPVQLAELEAAFSKCSSGVPKPSRYLKSQKPKELPAQTNNAAATEDPDFDDEDNEDGGTSEALDPYELADPVEILPKLPNNFWEQLESKKWQERKEALDVVEQLSSTIRLKPGDYGDLMKALLKVMAKDTNVILVGQAAKVVTQIANGLRNTFRSYGGDTVKVCLEKFKERKPAILGAIRGAADAAVKSISLDSIQEEVIAAMANKNPGIRSETCLFLGRSFSTMTAQTLNKRLLKTFIAPLINNSADTCMDVREASFSALGTAMLIISEKHIMPFLADIDNIRVGRIKEFYEKLAKEKNESPGSAPVGTAAASKQFKVVKGGKPGTAAKPEAATKTPPPPAPATVKKKKPAGGAGISSAPAGLPKENLIQDELLEQQLTEFFGEALLTDLASAAWKERLAAAEVAQTKIRGTAADPLSLSCQVAIRLLLRKPGLKDNNFQVLRLKIELIAEILAARKPCSEVIVDLLMPALMDKLSDVKVGEATKVAYTALADATSFEIVGGQVLRAAFQQKNPKAQTEALNWLALAIKEFGLKINPNETVSFLKTGLSANNVSVRQSCIHLSAVLYLYMGATLRTMLSDEKPAMVAMLEEEWNKLGDSKPPPPSRGLRLIKKAPAGTEAGATAVESEETGPEPDDIVDRTDISEKLCGDVLTLLSSKNWKERKEGLEQVAQLLKSNPFIRGTHELQEPLSAVGKVCTDVNKILGKTTLGLMETFAKALSKADAKKMVKLVEPSILICFGESKPFMREAAVNALDAWKTRTGFVPLTENDMLSEALKVENPYLRTELLTWLAIALADFNAVGKKTPAGLAPDFALNLALSVYAVCEERNQEARQRAHKLLPVLIRSFGYETMQKALKRLKASSMDAVSPLLEKAREQVIVEEAEKNPPEPDKSKVIRVRGEKNSNSPSPAPTEPEESCPTATTEEDTTTSTMDPVKSGKKGAKKPPMTAKRAAALEQSEEAAAMVPLQVNKLRETRMQDEKKRKLLKWDFDAPSRDHVQQLNTLFATAGASSDLHACLFHSDFKQHIKAIDILNRLLEGGWASAVDGEAATRANLDLILRWMVLRFFETSPAFLSRGLEYLIKVFNLMSESEQQLTEYEGAAFIPYLVMKVGDPKDNIRRDIRTIFKVLVTIYPPSKFYVCLTGGLKSKVNKARQECLEEIGSMIDDFGLNVCQPSPVASMKVLAAQIADRDSGVRTAALNALVCAYTIVGEPLWKMIGDLSDKDRSMLEERIKRSGRPQTAASSTASKRSASERPANRRQTQPSSQVHQQQQQQQQLQQHRPQALGTAGGTLNSVHSIAYARAQHMLSELGDLSAEQPPAMPNLIQLDSDISELFKPIEIPELKTRDKQQPVLNCLLRTSPDAASAITMFVTQISSNDLNVCCYALSQIDTLLQSDKWQLLMGHINQIITLITIQLRQTNSRFFDDPTITPNQLADVLRCLLVTIGSIFKRHPLTREVSRESLKEFMFATLHLLVHEKTSELPEGQGLVRTINAVTLDIVQQANNTRILGAFIRLLHESVSSGHFSNRYTQVVLKCIWRITRALQDTANNYALESILLDCHNFFKAFPSTSWKARKSDLPLRTMKTLLHSLCSVRGPSIVKFLFLIPNKEESELESYLVRTLKSLSNGGKLPPSLQPSSPTKQSDAHQKTAGLTSEAMARVTQLCDKIITSKDHSFIEELYNMTTENPELNLEPFLAGSTPFFQTYVQQALYNVGLQRAASKASAAVGSVSAHGNGVQSMAHAKPQICIGDSQFNSLIRDRLFRVLRGSNDGAAPGPFDRLPTVAPDDLSNQPADPKLFLDRLATLRTELGLDNHANVGDGCPNTYGVDADGRPSGTTMMEATLRGNIQQKSEEDHPNAQGATEAETIGDWAPKNTGGGMSQNELTDIRRRLEMIKNAQARF